MLKIAQDVLHSFRHGTMSKENESVAFACRITLGDEESMHELRRIRDDIFEFTID
jgi:hypothetical protein